MTTRFLIGEYVEIEDPVVGLVDALNEIPGVVTLISCGGHAERERFDQAPEGCFYVSFLIEGRRRWGVLSQIANAIPEKGILIEVQAGDYGELLFTLSGGRSDEVAALIRNAFSDVLAAK